MMIARTRPLALLLFAALALGGCGTDVPPVVTPTFAAPAVVAPAPVPPTVQATPKAAPNTEAVPPT